MRFVRGGEPAPIALSWWPRFYLSYSGQRGMTAECVGKVKRLFESQPALAERLDAQMKQAVQMAEGAFGLSETEGQPRLREALLLARDCFEKWDLCGGDVRVHMALLEEAGAGAVKPTGSGGGGFILSLWQTDPPANLLKDLVPVLAPQLLV